MMHSHPWRARVIVTLLMVILGFIGLVITDISKVHAWTYWRLMVPVFAILCLGLSWYLRKGQHVVRITTIWHEILHWIGLGLSVYLVDLFVRIGIMGRFEAALMVLTLLSLTTFLAGLYVDVTFVAIGILLGAFVAGAAYLEEYLYSIFLPITLGAVIVLFLIIHRSHRKHSKE